MFFKILKSEILTKFIQRQQCQQRFAHGLAQLRREQQIVHGAVNERMQIFQAEIWLQTCVRAVLRPCVALASECQAGFVLECPDEL